MDRTGTVLIPALGCTGSEFGAHIESLFQPGMTWENRGRNGWVFDHIKPRRLFDLRDTAQKLEAGHYTNIQPLWVAQNNQKSYSYDPSPDWKWLAVNLKKAKQADVHA